MLPKNDLQWMFFNHHDGSFRLPGFRWSKSTENKFFKKNDPKSSNQNQVSHEDCNQNKTKEENQAYIHVYKYTYIYINILFFPSIPCTWGILGFLGSSLIGASHSPLMWSACLRACTLPCMHEDMDRGNVFSGGVAFCVKS